MELGWVEDAGAVVQEWLSLPPVAVGLWGWRVCGYVSTFAYGWGGVRRHDALTVLLALGCLVPWYRLVREGALLVLMRWPASEGALAAAGL